MPYTVKKKRDIPGAIAELHHGKTFSRTKRKFGKAKAESQAQAIAYSMWREHKRRRKAHAY